MLLTTAPTDSRMARVSSTPKPGMWKPMRRSGCQASGRMSNVRSSVPMIHSSTAMVMATGTMTSRPDTSHLRRASMTFLVAGTGAPAATGRSGGCVGLDGGRRRVRRLGSVGGLPRIAGGWRGGRCAGAAEVGGVPAGALELETRGGQLLVERGGAAGRANREDGVRDFLQHVLGMATGAAFVRVDGHGAKGSWLRCKALNYRRGRLFKAPRASMGAHARHRLARFVAVFQHLRHEGAHDHPCKGSDQARQLAGEHRAQRF